MRSSDESLNRRRDGSILAFALVFPTLVTVVYFILLAGHSAAIQQAVYAVGKFIQFLFPAVWVARYQPAHIGWRRPRRNELVLGAGLGLALLASALALFHFGLKPAGFFEIAISKVREKIEGAGVGTVPRYVALAVFYVVFHSLLEEYYWRWFVFGRLRRLTSLPRAIGVSSLGFMAHHVCIVSEFFGWFSPASIVLSLAVVAGGAMWAWFYERTGSLVGPWISHALVDAAIFVVGYDLVM